jgi:hypothetical protein
MPVRIFGGEMNKILLTGVLGVITFAAPAAHSAIIIQSFLSGANAVPASGSSGFGIGTVILDDTQTVINVNLQVFNLQGFATSAGIYGPAFPGTAGPLRFPLFGVPFAQSFNVNGQFDITPDEVANLLSHEFYFNVYSTAFPEGDTGGTLLAFTDSDGLGEGGELRGQIDTVVPEPAAGAMVLLGLGACWLGRRRLTARRS